MNLLTANQNDNILRQNSASNGFLVSKRSPGLGMLVIIDPRVENYGMLASGVLPGAKIVILESGEDGVRQVSKAIFDYPVSSLHIVGHGSPGSMQLGNTRLSLGNLAAYGAELEKWGEAIGCGGILLYGCEVAAGDIGAAFVERLHELSGVGVAAAVGRVGCGELGGSWELGVKVGNVGDGLAFGEEVFVGYGGVFAENSSSIFASQIDVGPDIPAPETPPNSPPIAVDDFVSTPPNTEVTFSFLSNDSDPDGDNFGINSFDNSSTNGGIIELNDNGTFTYTPPLDFTDTDTFTYTIIDDFGNTDTATVRVTIASVNNQPDAVDDSITTSQDTAVSIPVLSNDSDIDNDPLTIITPLGIPSNGTVSINDQGTIDTTDDEIIYTPNSGFIGPDTFTYTIDDGNGGTDTATVRVTIASVNNQPD
ncbi:Ig-like domain-containing protein, partial [Dapis sp. BLCC M126]|uniref:Ig-like domain-containing protein n=1 Tax=Dapis sp. BLCC M126 TaxID=3400189 RepID=UPI003CE9BB8A